MPTTLPPKGHMDSVQGRVNFLATGDSILPAGAAQPMALNADDVMLLLHLLLGTGQRILLEVQAVELLRRVGGGRERLRGREGQGQAAKLHRTASASSLSPASLCLP